MRGPVARGEGVRVMTRGQLAAVILAAVAVSISLYTTFSNPDMTTTRLLVDFWPRYLFVCALLATAAVLAEWRR